jgi:hypothetical protein
MDEVMEVPAAVQADAEVQAEAQTTANESQAPESTPETTPGEDAAAEIRQRAEKRAQGVQKRIDELTREKHEALRLAQTLAERLQAAGQGDEAKPKATHVGTPDPSQFSTYEDYIDALTDFKIEQRETARTQQYRQAQAQREQAAMQERAQAQLSKGAEKYADFYEVVTDPSLPVTGTMAAAMAEAENGADVAYYLGTNPKEAQRIASLSPTRQAIEIGKIEAKLSAQPVTEATKAPPPIKPLSGVGKVETDPDKMSTEDWLKWRNKQLKTR